jgi:hypothetical protein
MTATRTRLLIIGLLVAALFGCDRKSGGSSSPVAQSNVMSTPSPGAVSKPPSPPAVSVPDGWEKFNDPLGEIAVYFPSGQPEKNQAVSDTITKQSGLPGDYWTKAVGEKSYVLSRITATEAEVTAKKPEAILFDSLKGFAGSIPGSSPGKYELPIWDSMKRISRIVVFDFPNENKRAVVRGVISGNRVVLAIVIGEPGIGMKDKDIQPFLDNVQFVK